MNTNANHYFKLEHGIPIPERRARAGKWIDLLRSMKVGDSFTIPYAMRTFPSGVSQRIGVKVTTRKLDEKTMRVWRVK